MNPFAVSSSTTSASSHPYVESPKSDVTDYEFDEAEPIIARDHDDHDGSCKGTTPTLKRTSAVLIAENISRLPSPSQSTCTHKVDSISNNHDQDKLENHVSCPSNTKRSRRNSAAEIKFNIDSINRNLNKIASIDSDNLPIISRNYTYMVNGLISGCGSTVSQSGSIKSGMSESTTFSTCYGYGLSQSKTPAVNFGGDHENGDNLSMTSSISTATARTVGNNNNNNTNNNGISGVVLAGIDINAANYNVDYYGSNSKNFNGSDSDKAPKKHNSGCDTNSNTSTSEFSYLTVPAFGLDLENTPSQAQQSTLTECTTPAFTSTPSLTSQVKLTPLPSRSKIDIVAKRVELNDSVHDNVSGSTENFVSRAMTVLSHKQSSVHFLPLEEIKESQESTGPDVVNVGTSMTNSNINYKDGQAKTTPKEEENNGRDSLVMEHATNSKGNVVRVDEDKIAMGKIDSKELMYYFHMIVYEIKIQNFYQCGYFKELIVLKKYFVKVNHVG